MNPGDIGIIKSMCEYSKGIIIEGFEGNGFTHDPKKFELVKTIQLPLKEAKAMYISGIDSLKQFVLANFAKEELEKKEITFPKLMTTEKGTVILVIRLIGNEDMEGFIVKPFEGDNREIGYYAKNWDRTQFKDYNNSVTIRNIE